LALAQRSPRALWPRIPACADVLWALPSRLPPGANSAAYYRLDCRDLSLVAWHLSHFPFRPGGKLWSHGRACGHARRQMRLQSREPSRRIRGLHSAATPPVGELRGGMSLTAGQRTPFCMPCNTERHVGLKVRPAIKAAGSRPAFCKLLTFETKCLNPSSTVRQGACLRPKRSRHAVTTRSPLRGWAGRRILLLRCFVLGHLVGFDSKSYRICIYVNNECRNGSDSVRCCCSNPRFRSELLTKAATLKSLLANQETNERSHTVQHRLEKSSAKLVFSFCGARLLVDPTRPFPLKHQTPGLGDYCDSVL
jgi:hypothetical protein